MLVEKATELNVGNLMMMMMMMMMMMVVGEEIPKEMRQNIAHLCMPGPYLPERSYLMKQRKKKAVSNRTLEYLRVLHFYLSF